MNAGAKLALYGAGLVVAFGASYGLAGVIVPASFVADWVASGESHGDAGIATQDSPGEHASQAPAAASGQSDTGQSDGKQQTHTEQESTDSH